MKLIDLMESNTALEMVLCLVDPKTEHFAYRCTWTDLPADLPHEQIVELFRISYPFFKTVSDEEMLDYVDDCINAIHFFRVKLPPMTWTKFVTKYPYAYGDGILAQFVISYLPGTDDFVDV